MFGQGRVTDYHCPSAIYHVREMDLRICEFSYDLALDEKDSIRKFQGRQSSSETTVVMLNRMTILSILDWIFPNDEL